MECPVCMQHDENENSEAQESANNANISQVQSGNGNCASFFVVGDCGHPVCLACMKRIVSGRKQESISSSEGENLDEIALRLPLRGRCPMCRKILSLFDMRRASKTEWTHQGSTLALQDQLDFQCRPLAGLTFKISHGHEVSQGETEVPWLYSISFPSSSNAAVSDNKYKEGSGQDLEMLPFVVEYGAEQKLHRFRPGSFYFHSKSNTFQGELDVERNGQKEVWTICVQFSSGMQCVCGGGLLIETPCKNKRGPLDGTWKVTWSNPPGAESATINVTQSFFNLYGFTYRIEFSQVDATIEKGDEKNLVTEENIFFDDVSFRWPNFSGENIPRAVQKLSQIERTSPGNGLVRQERLIAGKLENGTVLTWTTSEDTHKKIQWTLIDREPTAPETTNPNIQETSKMLTRISPLCPPNGPVYTNTTGRDSGETNDLSNSQTTEYFPYDLWGNSFVQGNTDGLASYHFIHPSIAGDGSTGSYISYSNMICSLNWPTLDDGQPIPSRIYFENETWNSELREFRGIIDWHKTHGTTWQGSYSWRYRMVFDSKFLCILAGEVWSRQHPQSIMNESGNDRIEEHENEMSRYGATLNYINAAAGKMLLANVERIYQQNSTQQEAQVVEGNAVMARRIILEELMRLESEGIAFSTSSNLRLLWQHTLDTQLRRNSL